MRYSGIVINKLLGMPSNPQPSQFYLIETGGTTRLYLSDSKANLIPLGSFDELNLALTDATELADADEHNVYNNKGATTEIPILLPVPEKNLEYEFVVLDVNGIVVGSLAGEDIYLGNTSADYVTSDEIGSFLRLRAINGTWVAREITGLWNLGDGDIISYGGVPITSFGTVIYKS
jgi:hypothetical protein